MHGIWTTEHIRTAEAEVLARTPEGALMRRAAFGVATEAAAMLAAATGRVAGRRVVLLVGAGNNGGDALWAGAFLRRRGVAVTAVLLAPDRTHPAGLAALRRAGGRAVAPAVGKALVPLADLVIDGIVGLSAHGPLRPEAAELVAEITSDVLAVDLPSGVEPDTGEVTGPAVRATATMTFGGRKPVHVLAAGPAYSGRVTVLDLGVPLGEPDLVSLDVGDVGRAWPVPGPDDNKYSQGVTGLAAGSERFPGAAVLATGAAVLATSGMVRFAGTAAAAVLARWPEVVAAGSIADTGRVQAWVIGPGYGTGSASRDGLRTVLGAGVPVCADADAVTMLATNPELWDAREPGTPMVLTPHDGEFERLVGEPVGADRVAAALGAARRFDVVLLLKGHTTVVAAPDGRVLVNPARSSWPATAGSGDVLSGLVGALLAARLDPWLAAGAAAFLHSLAADLAADGAPAPASALSAAIPQAIRLVRAAAR